MLCFLTFAASHHFKSKENSDIVLVPQPTDDPNDPLNWPRWKKICAFTTLSLFAVESGWIVGAVSTGIVLLMEEFHTDLNTTVDGVVNWSILLLGLGVKNPIFHNSFFIGLLLGSHSSALWHTSCFTLGHAYPFHHIDLVCPREEFS